MIFGIESFYTVQRETIKKENFANWWKIQVFVFAEKTFANCLLVLPKDAMPPNFVDENTLWNAHGLAWTQCETLSYLFHTSSDTCNQLFLCVVNISVNYCIHASLRCSLSEGLVSWGPVRLLRGLQGRDGDDLGSLRTLWERVGTVRSSRSIQVPTIRSAFCIQTYWLNLGEEHIRTGGLSISVCNSNRSP